MEEAPDKDLERANNSLVAAQETLEESSARTGMLI
jgi:hypothetical protein